MVISRDSPRRGNPWGFVGLTSESDVEEDTVGSPC
jgi:hypothetical protein